MRNFRVETIIVVKLFRGIDSENNGDEPGDKTTAAREG